MILRGAAGASGADEFVTFKQLVEPVFPTAEGGGLPESKVLTNSPFVICELGRTALRHSHNEGQGGSDGRYANSGIHL